MRVLITGGAGFIGSRTALALARAGHQPVILDNLLPQIHTNTSENSPIWRLVRERFETIVGDVRDQNAVERAVATCDAVIHLAAETGTGQSMYEVRRYCDVNVSGTATLLEAVSAYRDRVQRFVVASSRSIYGEGSYDCAEHGLVTPDAREPEAMARGEFEPRCPQCGREIEVRPTAEDASLKPASIYAVTKLSQEQMVSALCPSLGVPWTAFRYQNVYGPGQSLHNPYTGILSVFSRVMVQGGSIEIFEDGFESRDFVFIDDVVAANVAAIVAPTSVQGSFNVGTGAPVSVRQVVETLARNYGFTGPILTSGRFRAGDIRHNFADVSKLAEVMGLRASTSFEAGIKQFCEWAGKELANGVSDQQGYAHSLAELTSRGLLSGGPSL